MQETDRREDAIDKPMRVLVVLASNARRGAEIEGEQLAHGLEASGMRARVVALSSSVAGPTLDVPVLGAAPLATRTLRRLRAEAARADVVVAHGSTALPACAIGLVGTRVPFVYRSIGDPAAWVRGRVHRARTGILMRRAAGVVALWDGAADALCQLYRLPRARVTVIPNARSAEQFRPPTPDERSSARRDLGIEPGVSVAAVVGSLTNEKRVDLAMEAVAQLDATHLVVAGDGPLRTELELQGERLLGPRVRFLGALTDVRPVYHAADVVVLASRTEGMPGVAIEAGLSGVPVAACRVGALPWLFEHGLRGADAPRDVTGEELGSVIEEALGRSAPADRSLEECELEGVRLAWVGEMRSVLASVPG